MSNTKHDFYDILNATSNATIDELKSNYKQLILQCHPDKLLQQQQQEQQQQALKNNTDKLETDDPNNTKFIEITEAWNCLKDPIKRKQYDAELLLNKFHTHNNIYAHIKLSEMKKQLNTGAYNTNTTDNEEEEKVQEVCNTSNYLLYTYDCRCGGQYIIDESAEQYCRRGNDGSHIKNNDNNSIDYDDADNQNNKNSPNNIEYKNAGDGDGGISDSTVSNNGESIVDDENHDDEEGNELIVECSECSLVIYIK